MGAIIILILLGVSGISLPELSAQPMSLGLDSRKEITQYVHRVWQTEQGLPQNSAYALCQTQSGYLWIGTAEGLVRFDGVHFTTFTKNSTPALQSNWISSFAEHPDGRLYIGTRAGVVCLFNGIFTNVSASLGMPPSLVRALLFDNNGSLWIATNSDGVFCLPSQSLRHTLNTSRQTQAKADSVKILQYTTRDGLKSNSVLSLMQTPDNGAVWLGTQGQGINRIYAGRVDTPQGQGSIANASVRALLCDRDGRRIWIGAQNGLSCYSNGSFASVTAKNALSQPSIQALLQDYQGTLWVGTFGGVYRLRNGIWDGFTDAQGLSNNTVQSLLQDHEGSLWIGTFGGGINSLHNGTFTKYTERHGLTNKYVHSVLCSDDGRVWAATNGGGLNVLEHGVFRRYGYERGLKSTITASLMLDSYRFWVGSHEGVYALPRNTTHNVRTLHYTRREGLSHNSVWVMLPDSLLDTDVHGSFGGFAMNHTTTNNGALWCGTNDGLNYIRDGVVMRTYRTEQGLSNNVILCLLYGRTRGRKGTEERGLWIGTQKGLNIMLKDTILQFTRRDGLTSDFIWSLLQDNDGTVWIGTTNGLHRFKNGVFTACTSRNGLFDDTVFSLIDDGLGWLWMSCNRGIYRVRKADLHAFADGKLGKVVCENFGTADGMMSAECNGGSPSVSKDASGCLWYPTIAGVVMVNPQMIVRNPLPPKLQVESLKADSAEWSLPPLVRSNISAQSLVTLPVGADKLEIHYTACSFRVPQRVYFRYTLEGYDKSWTEAGRRRVAYYNNLPRGRTYRFRVQACNESGLWNEAGASVDFFLPLFFYETWWFIAVCICSGIGSIVFLVRLRLRRLQQRALYLESAIAKRTRELAEANLELQAQNQQLVQLNYEKNELLGIVSHDLKNPLGAVRGLAELLHQGFVPPQDVTVISEQIMTAGDRMLDLVSNLLEINLLEVGGRQFSLQTFDVIPIITTTIDQYQIALKQKTIHVHFSYHGSAYIIGDEQGFIQVIDNLISNAVKYSPYEKNIWVKIEQSSLALSHLSDNTVPVPMTKDRYVRMEIQDEGPGISPEDMKKLFGKFARLSARPTGGEHSTGLGLSIVKKTVEAMNGRVWCESELGKGATFIVELPQGNHAVGA